MRIASWNVNSLRKRQGRLLAWLAETRPDIVCLQETKCADDQFPELILQSAGYCSVFHGQKSYNGVAILSRMEPHDVRESLCDEVEDSQARVIAASIGRVRIFSIYAPNGQRIGSPAYHYKLEWFDRLGTCLRATDNLAHLVVAGDFNVAPSDRDVHDPKLWHDAIMCSEKERAAFRQLCELGLSDSLRLHHQEAGLFSWWDYRMLAFPKDRGLRIDAILVGKSLATRCRDAGIDRDMRKGDEPSDHVPVWAEFSDLQE